MVVLTDATAEFRLKQQWRIRLEFRVYAAGAVVRWNRLKAELQTGVQCADEQREPAIAHCFPV
jgi:hypothetical protein